MSLYALVISVFVLVAGAVVGVAMLLVSRARAQQAQAISNRLQEFGGAAAQADGAGSLLAASAGGPLPNVDRAARLAIKGSGFERWLEQTGTKMSLTTCFLMAVALATGCGMAAVMFSHLWWVGAIGFAMGLCIEPMILRQRRGARLYKFEEHFPEALDLLSRAVRAGHAFSAGMKMVADELDDPVGPEFRKAFDEQNYGLPLKESLNNLSERIPLLDVRFFSTAVLIQRETGGNLSEILDNLANVVRERFKIRRQVRVHTAHGRFTGYVLMALPAFLALALSFINPEHMQMLFEEQMGHYMILGCIVMQAIGFIWIKQIVKIEV
jgi:tight adherence protein B